ncbi:MAG: alanine--glyoxylate aminotransferase family protein [Candidatus Melainabacteria bacterium]|nr:alanine--glyoxylate aminotransferase family protein [Candidatus Melainabacteria bacterium]
MPSIQREFLMIPGPTPVPDRVLAALAKHPIGHRSPDFSDILMESIAGLKWLGDTENEPLILASSGTGGMDGAIANTVNRGDKVLSLVCGVFGERFAKIAEAYGADVTRITAEFGKPIDPQAVRDALAKDTKKEIKAVTITHNETSTGVINDLETIAGIIKEHGALSLVDAVTSFGATPVPIDAWGLDIVVTGSQKALMLPPGLGFAFVSEKAWKAVESCSNPRFYLDFRKYLKSQRERTTPFTPNVSFVVALVESIKMMKEEGKDEIFKRHVGLRETLRKGVRELGLKPCVDDAHASPSITSIYPPDSTDVPAIRKALKERFRITVADGQEELKGKIFRMGHMGYVFERDIGMALYALKEVIGQPAKAKTEAVAK